MSLPTANDAILAAKQYLWIQEIDDILFGVHLASPGPIVDPAPGPAITPSRLQTASLAAGVWTVKFPFAVPGQLHGGEPVIKLSESSSTPESPVVAEPPEFDQ